MKEQEQELLSSIKSNTKIVESLPTVSEIKRKSKIVQKVLERSRRNYYSSAHHYLKMEWEEKRELCELLFSGTDVHGNRAGVYMDKDSEGNWHYQVRGIIDCQIKGKLPITDIEVMDLLDVDSDDSEVKQDLFGKCHAYYGFGFY